MLNKSHIIEQKKDPLYNEILANLYYFEDSDGFILKSADLAYKRDKITNDIAASVDVGAFSFGHRNGVMYKGMRYGATLFYKKFSFRLGKNDFEDFSEIVPTLIYKDNYKKNYYTLEYTRQNALFYTYSEIPYKKRIVTDHFAISDSIVFSEKSDLWANVTVNNYSNKDIGLIGQFDYIFYRDTFYTPKFTYALALEGWYTSHKKQHSDFYSPAFSDATLLRIDPKYVFSKSFGLQGRLGLGYSFHDETTPYKYGLWAFGEPINNMSYKVGCLESNAARLSNGPNYNYLECKADLGYLW